jgi:opacity protein-like surface antigen
MAYAMLIVPASGVLMAPRTREKAAMKANIGVAIATGVLAVVTCAGVASAQENETTPGYMRVPLRAPRNAFELGVSTGYTQGFGDITAGRRIQDVANAGAGVGVTLGYRSSPGLGLGLDTSYQQFRADDGQRKGTNVRGMSATAEAIFHIAPFERIDPFISLGTGYRLLWNAPPGRNNNTLTHGIELARLNAGLDIRLSDNVALGPTVGGGLNYFLWENPEGPRGDRMLRDRHVSTFVFAGLQGRFDVGGLREERVVVVGKR